jgi:cyclopropane-fatty-acyl-phospholipid synthase
VYSSGRSVAVPEFEVALRYPGGYPDAKMSIAETMVTQILARADVQVNGKRPHDIRVHDSRAFQRMFNESGFGFAESYMDQWWDCDQLDELISRLLGSDAPVERPSWGMGLRKLASATLNLQSRSRARQVCDIHYDIGNDLFQKMLDSRMVYTCAYWKTATTLEAAQEDKLDLICRKLDIKPGMKILDIGCGWGSFMKFAAERYGASCVGYTLSPKQLELGSQLCAGLDIEFRLKDYRDIEGKYDRVVSIGMLEAVGWRNFGTYMQVVSNSLEPEGLALIHTMGRNNSTYYTHPWIDRYIFPNGIVPSIQQLGRAFENILVMEDWHNFGPDYDLTLMEWNRRFQSGWNELAGTAPIYTPRFKRMWEFYLLAFAANFRSRNLQLWQLVLSLPGRKQPLCRQS